MDPLPVSQGIPGGEERQDVSDARRRRPPAGMTPGPGKTNGTDCRRRRRLAGSSDDEYGLRTE